MAFEKLDIIIPQYNETEEEVRPLLSSIANQVGVSKDLIKVTIVNDHSQWKLSNSFLNSFGLDITYLETPENGGAGMARQCGIDNTSNPLIMFCDADDRLFDCAALLNLYNAIRVNNIKSGRQVNIITSSFYEEHISPDGKAYDLIKHEKPTMIWMHGKIFRRQFLIDNNIRFHPTLRTFEDTFFGKMVALSSSTEEQIHCNYYTYLWVRNPKSITSNWNHDKKDYLYWRNDDYITCNRDLIKGLYERNPQNPHIRELLYVNLFFSFFMLQFNEFLDNDPLTIQKANNLVNFILELIDTYKDYLKRIPMRFRLSCYKMVKDDMPRYNFYVESIAWNSFVKKLEQIKGESLDWLLMFN